MSDNHVALSKGEDECFTQTSGATPQIRLFLTSQEHAGEV